MLGAGALLTAAAALTASATSIPLLQAGAFAFDVTSGAYYASAVPLIGDLYPDAVGRAVGVHGVAARAAAVLAPTLAVALVACLAGLYFAGWFPTTADARTYQIVYRTRFWRRIFYLDS